MLQYGYCPKTTRKILQFAIIRDAYHMNFTSMLLSQTKWRSVQSQQTEPYAYEIKYASTFLFHNNTSSRELLNFFAIPMLYICTCIYLPPERYGIGIHACAESSVSVRM
jgi:hypothetical protein